MNLQPILALAFAASLAAQAPSAWSTLTPPAAVDFRALLLSDKLALYRMGDYLRVFSAVTGHWHALTVSFGTTPHLYSDMLLVPESDRWTAFSAYRGVFEVLYVNQPATTLQAGTSIAVVRDGGMAYVFSAYTGRWHPHAVPADWVARCFDNSVVFTTPATATACQASAIDVYTGQRHDLPVQPASLAGFVGAGSSTLLTLLRPNSTHYYAGFSSLHPAWVLDSGGGTGAYSRMAAIGGDMLVSDDRTFSGITGTFSVAPPNPLLEGDGFMALAGSPETHIAGAVHNAWVALPTGAVPLVANFARQAIRLYSMPGLAVAFDALTNQTSSYPMELAWPFPISNDNYSGAVASLNDWNTGVPALYSALTHQWYSAPAGALAQRPSLFPAAALLRTGTGVVAFAGRSGRFVPLAGTGLNWYTDTNVVAVQDASTLYFFDARTERWLTRPTPARQQVYRGGNVMLVMEPTQVTGVSAASGRLESVQVNASNQWALTSGSATVVYTSSQVLAFTGLPENLSWFSFPNGYRACGIGTTYRQQLRLGAGSVALLGLGRRAATPLALPPFGELWLDPAAIDVRFVAAAPGEERVVSEWPVPADPALHGSEWWQQALMLPPSGVPWLTDVEWLWIL